MKKYSFLNFQIFLFLAFVSPLFAEDENNLKDNDEGQIKIDQSYVIKKEANKIQDKIEKEENSKKNYKKSEENKTDKINNKKIARENKNIRDESPLKDDKEESKIKPVKIPTLASTLNAVPENTKEEAEKINILAKPKLPKNKKEEPKTLKENDKITIEEKIHDEELQKMSYNDIKKIGHLLRTEPKSEHQSIFRILKKLGKKASPATSEIIASIHEGKTGKEAVDILLMIGNDPAIAGLARLISSKNPDLSNYILQKISSLKERAQFVVDDIFANYQNKALKEKIILALGEIKGQRSYYELKEILKGQESDDIKILALNALTKFDNLKDDLPLLRRLFRINPPSKFTSRLSDVIMGFETYKVKD